MQKDQYDGRVLGVFTSGGDSQGMNASLRAIVRMGIYIGCKVYLIHEVCYLVFSNVLIIYLEVFFFSLHKKGYQGMVEGHKHFELATWSIVSGIVGLVNKELHCFNFFLSALYTIHFEYSRVVQSSVQLDVKSFNVDRDV